MCEVNILYVCITYIYLYLQFYANIACLLPHQQRRYIMHNLEPHQSGHQIKYMPPQIGYKMYQQRQNISHREQYASSVYRS